MRANYTQGGLEDDTSEVEIAISQAIAEIRRFRPNGKIQGAVYNLIRDRFHACDLTHTMQRRCVKYFSIDARSIDFLQVFSIANALGAQVGFSMFKTLLGAWITNRRIQSDVRPCIFYGMEQDSLQHIINCDIYCGPIYLICCFRFWLLLIFLLRF